MIDRASRALATAAVHRLEGSEHAAALETVGRGALANDAAIRLEHLAEALAAGHVELLRLDLAWLAATYRARGAELDVVRALLDAVVAELGESLPDEAGRHAADTLSGALDELDRPHELTSELEDDSHPAVELARELLLAALEGRRRDAETLVLDAHESGLSLDVLHQTVIGSVQVELGLMWQRGDIHVAEEHLSSRIVESALTLLRRRIEPAPANGRALLVASVPGNLHEIGARMVADRFEAAGWRALFLGANTPSEDLAHAARDFEVDLVALSSGITLNVRQTASMIAKLRDADYTGPILVGGRPFALIEGLWKTVGADATASNPLEALDIGARLVGE